MEAWRERRTEYNRDRMALLKGPKWLEGDK
jgi:hypothetical protein